MIQAHDGSGLVVACAQEQEHGTVTYGENLLFGVPAEGVPAGVFTTLEGITKIRLRLRAKAYAKGFVRTAAGVRAFYLRRVNGGYELCHEHGANLAIKP